MDPDGNTDAAQALIRFGLGRKGAESLPSDPRGWASAQLDGADAGPAGMASTEDGLRALHQDREQKLQGGDRKVPPLARENARLLVLHAVDTATPFRERLVWFWANHFTVSIRQGGTNAVAAAFMQEAIRPHVTGKFGDMLLAVMRHPAMLMYLDNTGSIGPGSPAGLRQHRGLNENLARECMELHTLSPAAGYTQADVTGFAKLITGWSVDLKSEPPGFRFRPGANEPFGQTVLGQSFPAGEQGGVEALAFFAGHPATHRFLATKLVRHFVADDPPAAAVDRIAKVLHGSGGDLGAASRALVALPEAWADPLGKLRGPQDYVLAVARAADLPPDRQANLAGIMAALGQPLFNAPLPNGYADTAGEWSSPEAMMRRIDWAYGYTGRCKDTDAEALADACLGKLLRTDTQEAMHRAASRRDALTLLFTSPEFQRR
jgi:uncharacterized protein (DUF1800 family)